MRRGKLMPQGSGHQAPQCRGTSELDQRPMGEFQQSQCREVNIGAAISKVASRSTLSGRAIVSSQRTAANRAIRGFSDSHVQLAGETMSSSGIAVSVSKVVDVVVTGPAVESGDVSPVAQSSLDDACEEPLCPR